jgi:hypothetical protein
LAYVVIGDVAHEHTLDLGLHTPDGRVEVKSGLAPGDLLVTRGVEALSDGSKVKVVSAGPAGMGGPEASATGAPRPAGSAAALASAALEAPKAHKHRDGGPPIAVGEP